MRDLVSDVRAIGSDSPPKPLTPEELEARRRTAVMLRYQLERDPKQFNKVRESALQAGPMIARSARDGAYPADEFEAWLMWQQTSGVISADEVRHYRTIAGIP